MRTAPLHTRPEPAGRRARFLAAIGLSAVLTLAGCGGDAGERSADGPIVMGGVFTLTPAPFGTDAMRTAQQVFEDVNADGGIDGRQIRYVTGDDQASPTKGGTVARQAVSEGAVAMVGSASFVDCATNNVYYHRQKLLSIQGVGVDPSCFSSPDIASTTVSPFSQLTANMYYASEVLHDTRLCLFQPTTPGANEAVEGAIRRWEDMTGKTLLGDDHTIPTNQTSFTNELLRAKALNCDAVIYGGEDVVAAAMLKDAADQGMRDVDFLYASVSYTRQLAQAASGLDMNVHATTGLHPFTEKGERTEEWRATAARAGARQTAFSEAGYVCARWMVSVLESIDGPVTRASVTRALRSGKPYDSPLVAAPLVFGTGPSHDRTAGISVMKLREGQWARERELRLPDAS